MQTNAKWYDPTFLPNNKTFVAFSSHRRVQTAVKQLSKCAILLIKKQADLVLLCEELGRGTVPAHCDIMTHGWIVFFFAVNRSTKM